MKCLQVAVVFFVFTFCSAFGANHFDYELYFEDEEIQFTTNVPKINVSRTTDILFQPWYCSDETIGMLSRVRECDHAIEFSIVFYNGTGQNYRIGCCVIGDDVMERKVRRMYDLMIEKEIDWEAQFDEDVVAFNVPRNLGDACATQNGVKGVELTHRTCQSLIGYIERSDREFLTTSVHQGCCPVYSSAKYYFEYTRAAKQFVHTQCRPAFNTFTQDLENCYDPISCVVCDLRVPQSKIPIPPRYPFIARIGQFKNDTYQWGCGGVILSPTFILTIAECIHKKKVNNFFQWNNSSDFTVAVGPIENNSPNNAECCRPSCSLLSLKYSVAICACCPQYFRIQNVHIHPAYKNSNENARYNNLALLQLTEAITFTKFVRPAILPQSWYYPVTKMTSIETCRAHNQEQYASPFRHANLSNTLHCLDTWRRINRKKIPTGFAPMLQFCGYAEPDEMICRKGSPLVYRHSSTYELDMFVIHGMSVFARIGDNYQNKTDTKILYTRVFPYLKWLENVIWGDNAAFYTAGGVGT